MEVYLVKDEVQILPVSKAFSKTNKYNGYIKQLANIEQDDTCGNCEGADCNSDDDQVDHKILTLTDLPVALTSVSSDVDANKHIKQFADRLKMKLSRNLKTWEWDDLKLTLIIDDSDPNKLDGYFLLSDEFPYQSQCDVFARLQQEFSIANVDFSVQVSLCHLPTKTAPVSPESLLCLKSEDEDVYFCFRHHRVCSYKAIPVPREMKNLLGKRTGFIYSKIIVKATFNETAVDLLYGYLDGNMSLFKDGEFTDVEIRCKGGGEIVKCHREFLAGKSCVLRDKFREMLGEGGKNVGPWKLDMGMGKKGVESFLENIYCGRVSGGMRGCDAALELLSAAREYKVVGLEHAMKEIILAKGSSDFGYFSVTSALKLFLYARKDLVGLKPLRDKAVRVLQNYLKTASDKIVESKEYQALFINQPQVAIELSSLYIQLS